MGESIEQFVRRQNVERYRTLLRQVNDETQHQKLFALLAEEERKQRDAADPMTIDLVSAAAIRLALRTATIIRGPFEANQGEAN